MDHAKEKGLKECCMLTIASKVLSDVRKYFPFCMLVYLLQASERNGVLKERGEIILRNLGKTRTGLLYTGSLQLIHAHRLLGTKDQSCHILEKSNVKCRRNSSASPGIVKMTCHRSRPKIYLYVTWVTGSEIQIL